MKTRIKNARRSFIGAPTLEGVVRFAMSSRSFAQALRDEACQIGGQFAAPLPFALDRQFCRVKRMSRQEQFLLKLGRPSFVNEVEIELLIRSVDLIPHYGMTERGQVHPDLVRSPRVRHGA